MKGFGMILFILGISAADSEMLIIPLLMVAVGMVMILKGGKHEQRRR